MVSEEITIQIKTGLHVRPASQLVSLVKSFHCNVVLVSGGKRVPGTSIISILALGLKFGSIVEVSVNGPDESEALKTLVDFFNNLQD